MVKKLWMLCCIMMVMVVTIIVNVSAASAGGAYDLLTVDDEKYYYTWFNPEVEPTDKYKHLIGNYRITEVFQTGGTLDSFIPPEYVGAVIRIMCVKNDYGNVLGVGKLISAPANTILARALEELEVKKAEYGDDNIGFEFIDSLFFDRGGGVLWGSDADFGMSLYRLTAKAEDDYCKARCYMSGNKIYVYTEEGYDRYNDNEIFKKRFVLERISSHADDAMKEVGYLSNPVEQPRTPSSAEAKPNIRYHVEHVYLNSPGVATIEGYFANDGDIDGYAKLVELDLALTADNGQQMWAYSGIRHDVNIEVPANKYVNYTYYVQHKNIPEYHKRFKWKANTNTHWSTSAS